MVVHVAIAEAKTTVGTVPAFPEFVGPDEHVELIPDPSHRVSGLEDVANGVYTRYTHSYVDASGKTLLPGSPAQNFVRYAEYPGQRLFRKVKFDVNGNPLDEYTAEAVMFHQKFHVAPNKQDGWKRLVGQEVAVDGYSDLAAIAGASQWPAAVANLLDVNGQAAAGAPITAASTARKLVQVVNGPQTPKLVQPALDMWIPLLFW